MTEQEKLEVIEEAFNYYRDRNSLTSEDEKGLMKLEKELILTNKLIFDIDKKKGL